MVSMQRGLLNLAWVLLVLPAFGQPPNDVPQGHWAYEAVEELARAGLIKGYPPDGNFFGKRTVTRYEMATIIQRVLARVEEIYAKKGEAPPPGGVTPEQLAEVRRLVNEFKMELTVIGTDLQRVKEQIGELRGAVDAAKAAAEKAAADAAAAKQELEDFRAEFADLKEAFTIGRVEFENLNRSYSGRRLSGYVQARFEAFDTGETSLFANSGAGGTGQTPSNGGPAVGGPSYGFLVRRARLRASGPISARTSYTVHLDAQSVGAVSVIDAFIHIADLPTKSVAGRFGMFAPPFSYELTTSASSRESPERAFAFGINAADYPIFKTRQSATGGVVTPGSVLPLFVGQNRAVGAAFVWTSPGPAKSQTRIMLGVLNGEGRGAAGVRNLNNGVDLAGRAETDLLGGDLGVGVSGYYGTLAVRSGPPAADGTPTGFRQAFRLLGGADVRWRAPWGTTLRAEYLGGVFETTPDRAQYLQNNHVYAWYFTARHPVNKRLELVAKYDEHYPISERGKTAGGLGRMELVRKTIQGGLLYHLDEATRFRLWYAKGLTPYDPSATSGPLRSRLGLITGEVQASF